MDCEKCKATASMSPTKIFRFSGCLVAIGVSLLVPSLMALGMATFCGLGGLFSGGAATVDTVGKLKAETAKELAAIPNIPKSVLDDFEQDGVLEDATLAGLKPAMRERVETIEKGHAAGIAGVALGGTAVAGVSIAGVLVTYVIGIPAFIVGFVLILRKKVWRCAGCGYVFDRA